MPYAYIEFLRPDGSRPVDPGYGISGEHPDTGLPPVPGHPLPPIDPPPGTVWPPLPPSVPAGKALVLVFISGVGYRYAVVTIPEHETDPDYGVEGPEDGGEHPEHPDQGLPPQRPGARPPQPGQGLPQPPRPPQAGQLPVRPGQRPPTAGQLPGRTPPARPQPK